MIWWGIGSSSSSALVLELSFVKRTVFLSLSSLPELPRGRRMEGRRGSGGVTVEADRREDGFLLAA